MADLVERVPHSARSGGARCAKRRPAPRRWYCPRLERAARAAAPPLRRKAGFLRCKRSSRASRSPGDLGCWGVAQVVRCARRGWNGTVPGREERRKCPPVPATWRGCVCNIPGTCSRHTLACALQRLWCRTIVRSTLRPTQNVPLWCPSAWGELLAAWN